MNEIEKLEEELKEARATIERLEKLVRAYLTENQKLKADLERKVPLLQRRITI